LKAHSTALRNPAPQFKAFFSSSGSFATLAAIRRASSQVSFRVGLE
jgi:hypothetical protein